MYLAIKPEIPPTGGGGVERSFRLEHKAIDTSGWVPIASYSPYKSILCINEVESRGTRDEVHE
jgi:hypothetical protein